MRTDEILPHFVREVMPAALRGLMLSAIVLASIDSPLGSLSASFVTDIYRPLLVRGRSERHYLLVSRVTTGFWGIFAGFVAVYASSLGSLIEVVNRFGSFFYGSILGVFMLAILTRRATGTGAFVGLLAGMAAVAAVAFGRPDISFLWHNVLGAGVVFAVGMAISVFSSPSIAFVPPPHSPS